MDIVAHIWSQQVVGSPSFVWEEKLKHTKFSLKAWEKEKPLPTPTTHR